MAENGVVLGIVGSPNKKGCTNPLVMAALEGAAKTGTPTELIHMVDHVVDSCKDCFGWSCLVNLKCTYPDDAFEFLSQKVLSCGALILGAPVYWWDTSAMVKNFILKMFRVYARSGPLRGLPALGIGIAGGSGNGLISGLRPVYHFFQILQMRALEPLPATRFNFNQALRRASELGNQLAGMVNKRIHFEDLAERLLWYDSLPHLNLSRAAERRLLAALTTGALPADADPNIPSCLARADTLAAAGKDLESLQEITRVYEACVKAFEGK